jgi:hypothetical protein
MRPVTSADDHMLATLSRLGTIAPEVVELFDYLEDTPLWIKDEAGHYEWVNVAFLLNFGVRTRAEIIGRTDYDFCGEVLANQYRIDDERVLRGERILSRVELVGRFDHTARWCVTSKVPLHNPQGDIVGTAGVTRPLPRPDATGAAPGPADSPLSTAIRFISQHYADRITNEDLARGVRAVGAGVRAAVPGGVSVFAARLPARPAGAGELQRPGFLPEIAGRRGERVRVRRPEPFHEGVPPHHGRNPERLSPAFPGRLAARPLTRSPPAGRAPSRRPGAAGRSGAPRVSAPAAPPDKRPRPPPPPSPVIQKAHGRSPVTTWAPPRMAVNVPISPDSRSSVLDLKIVKKSTQSLVEAALAEPAASSASPPLGAALLSAARQTHQAPPG